MEPVSAALIGPVCLLALGGVVAAVVLWRRLAGPGARAVLARSGLLLATQVALTASIVLLANRYFVFYATWNDLLGNDPANVHVQHVQPQRAAGGLVDRTITGLGPERAGRDRDPAEDGRVDHLKIHGIRSGLESDADVYVPPQYFQHAYAGTHLPVVLLLGDGEPAGWLRDARVPEAARGVRPMLYVMARVQGPAGCMDVPGRRPALGETYLTQDLPAALASLYRVPQARTGWGVAGFGGGGQCAARLAMLRSDRFSAAASLNGRFDAPGGDLYGGSARYRLGNDLLWRLQHLPPPPVSVLAAAGGSGPHARQAERFAALAKPPMRAGTSFVDGPAATLAAWRGHIPGVLAWFGDRLRVPPGE
ncbi:hypothetical protein ACQPZP_37075 [Spirillospora sp. CA-142024]|uniref:hypothetical protein n=1 Tax=Spirillospora sp. CA-142024 TaxID=3240036 RepID=UPI003D91C833